MNKTKVLVILGPTAVGKSAVAVELAKQFNGEIISADSRQIYKGMDIGTGKITAEEMKGVPHHLLDVADPKSPFSVMEYVKLAEQAIDDISKRGKLPIICGGTGFYIDALVNKVGFPSVAADEELRKKLSKKTVEELFALLQEADPARAASLNHSDKNNPRRLIRAIEIAKGTKESAETAQSVEAKPMPESPYDPLYIGLTLPPEELAKKIEARLSSRIKNGMIEEVEKLHMNGLSWERLDELGLEYRYVAQFLQMKISQIDLNEQLAMEIRRYAKRQMTWFRRNKDIQWFKPEQYADITALIQQKLT